jgi:dienelactone hydrolase
MAEDSEVEVEIPTDDGSIAGSLALPAHAQGLVVFAHGSGSSRFSPRNRFVARFLQRAGLGTLLLDLLTPGEERRDEISGHLRFDIGLLASRLISASDWASSEEPLRDLHLGYFGASTGAAAALVAAAERPDNVGALVSRGGRPDLAGAALRRVVAPSLLIVGGADLGVVELNQRALRALSSPHRELRLVRGATHLFEEPGTLEEVARLATAWFDGFLTSPRVHERPRREHRPTA